MYGNKANDGSGEEFIAPHEASGDVALRRNIAGCPSHPKL